jgi:hypothetical protein
MQGVVRVDAPDGTPYLLVSRSGRTLALCLPGSGSERANVYVVRMGSRDKNGERLRSNRLRKGMETTDTPPETEDRVVKTLLFDGTTEWPHYDVRSASAQRPARAFVHRQQPFQLLEPSSTRDDKSY